MPFASIIERRDGALLRCLRNIAGFFASPGESLPLSQRLLGDAQRHGLASWKASLPIAVNAKSRCRVRLSRQRAATSTGLHGEARYFYGLLTRKAPRRFASFREL